MKKGLKILMALMQFDIGGAETHVVELAKELKRRGYEIIIASNGGAYEKEVEDFGIKHYKVPLQNKNPMNVISAFRTLEKIIKEEKVDLVHSHARIPSFILGKLKHKLKFPFVTSAHWVFSTGYGLKYITDWGEKTVAVSNDIKKYLTDNYNVNEKDIYVTINGIDLSKFSPDTDCSDIRKEFGISQNDFCIVGISRMDKDRSLASKQLITIVPELKKQIPNLKVLIVGGGNDEEEATMLAKESNSKCGDDTVILTGGRTDINKLVAVADLFVGVSRAALEAMAAGKNTIVAGNEGYIGLFDEDKLKVGIETNFCCRGCAETTKERIYNDIIRYINKSSDEKKSLSAYCRDTIFKFYSVEKMADDYVEAYKSALEIKRETKSCGITVSGYYGFGNSGDDALLFSIISDIRKQGINDRITVLSSNPDETKKVYGVNAVNSVNPFSVFLAVIKCKMFISGGGTLIQDGTSTKSLLYYLYLIKLAKVFGKKVFMYANGIGPVNKQGNITKCKKILNKVDVITVRDEKSLNVLQSIGVSKPEIKLTADPVFLLEQTENIDHILSKIGSDKYFCISIRKTKVLRDNFEEILAGAIKKISEMYNMTPVFIPLQNSDTEICENTIKHLDINTVLLSDRYSPADIMAVVAKSQMVIGMRLHMLIYSAAAAVPLVGIVYDPKVSGFMEYAHQNLYVNDYETTESILFELMNKCMQNSVNIRKDLEDVRELLISRAKENSKAALELYSEK